MGSYLILWTESSWGVSGLRENDPELLTKARETRHLAATANSLRVSQLLLSHLLKVNASKEPGGLYQLGLELQAWRFCSVYKCSFSKQLRKTQLFKHPPFQPTGYCWKHFRDHRRQLWISSWLLGLENQVLQGPLLVPTSILPIA